MSTNDPNGWFFYQGDNTVLGPRTNLFLPTIRNAWNTIPASRTAGDVLCSTYVTVATGAENNITPCVSSPLSSFWNLNGTVAPSSAWFCTPGSITSGNGPSPPNANNSLLLAQFTVRAGYTVSGELTVSARSMTSPMLLQTSQSFHCFC